MTERVANRPSADIPWDREFAFELAVCLWAERHWPPHGTTTAEQTVIVGRQLGVTGRRWDTLVLVVDNEGLQQRRQFGSRALSAVHRRILTTAPTDWQWYRDVFPDPPYSWQFLRGEIHTLDERGVLNVRKRHNRIEIKRQYVYPDWVDQLIAIENKPDLTASAAGQLTPQLEWDVALGVTDETWVATRATGADIEPVLLEDWPTDAGVLAFDPETMTGECLWYPRSLSIADWGTRIEQRPTGRAYDQSAARVEYVDPAWKRRKRIDIAERLYERGWRSYIDSLRPDCRAFTIVEHAGGLLPDCTAYGPCQTPTRCTQSCDRFEPEPPQWRTKDWPLAGGPGKRYQTMLADRRQRRREEQQ